MTKYYDFGTYKASIEKQAENYWFVTIKEKGTEYKYGFNSEAKALTEIVSYSEIEAEDF